MRRGAGECLAFTVPRRLMNAPEAKLLVDSSLQEKLWLHVNAAAERDCRPLTVWRQQRSDETETASPPE